VNAAEVFGGEESGEGELVFVWEEGGGEGEVGVEGAVRVGWRKWGSEAEAKGGVESCGMEEEGTVG